MAARGRGGGGNSGSGLGAVLGGQLGLPSRQPVLAGILSLVFGVQTEALDRLQERFGKAGNNMLAQAFVIGRTAIIAYQQVNQLLNIGGLVFGHLIPESWLPKYERFRETVRSLTNEAIKASQVGAFIGAQFGARFLALGQALGAAFGTGLEIGHVIEGYMDRQLGPGAFSDRLAAILADRFPNGTLGSIGFASYAVSAVMSGGISGLPDIIHAASTPYTGHIRSGEADLQADIRRLRVQAAGARAILSVAERHRRHAALQRVAAEGAAAPSDYVYEATPVHESAVLAEIQMRLAHVVAAEEAAAGIP